VIPSGIVVVGASLGGLRAVRILLGVKCFTASETFCVVE